MIQPLFRWAGGKSRFVKYISPYLAKVETYVEPFFGGGAVFCHMVNKGLAKKYVINDVNAEICKLYQDIKNSPQDVIKEMRALEERYIKLNKADRKIFYYDLRQKYWDDQTSGMLLFLMRTSFNGVWQLCVASKGLFGTPCGLLNETSVLDEEQILEWSAVLQNAKITCGDYSLVQIEENSIVYVDPPYRDCFTAYGTVFDDSEHLRLISWCYEKSKHSNVLLSNKTDGKFFEKNVVGADLVYYKATHTAGRRKQKVKKDKTTFSAKKVKEVLIIWNR